MRIEIKHGFDYVEGRYYPEDDADRVELEIVAGSYEFADDFVVSRMGCNDYTRCHAERALRSLQCTTID